MQKMLFLFLYFAVGKIAFAQETVVFHKRDQMGDLVKMTVTYAPERRDCRVFSEYAGQKREYWVIESEGTGKAQTLTVRYNYKDAILKREGDFATLQWKEKSTPEKFGKEISFAEGEPAAPNSLYVIQYGAQETGFYFVNADKKVLALEIDKDSPAKYWDKQLSASQAHVFKLSHYRLKEKITFTIPTSDDIMAVLRVGEKTYQVVPSDEN